VTEFASTHSWTNIDNAPLRLERKLLMLNGLHPGCLELRWKMKGVGELDGQSELIYFNDKRMLYTRPTAQSMAIGSSRYALALGLRHRVTFSGFILQGCPSVRTSSLATCAGQMIKHS
jgi:hypothetical protein